MRRSPAVVLVLLAVPLLAGCTDDPPAPAEASRSTGSSSAEPSPEPSDEPSPGPSASAPGQVERPAPGTCAAVPESPDGRYSLPGIGTLRLDAEGGGLSIEARSDDGWSINSSSDDDEVDVEFRRGDEDVDVEADLRDDGRLEIQICDDDD
ncbi:hypothetical protein DQ244_03215 [Blastococcus sp. TBT05-19]|uniref:hypothetical protein n=1 Tax=Blastococcus sp. TBT05-19 TaxID=2250581 RepID=UPI000DE82EDA|nr:hypothetical protein [Blastococcus sp. TBT05-19]RBY94350.1 hypothetical protein DQ244_03215 [Blastococcus sp. TBT05-19]